jgi:protein phosphatase
MGHSMVDTPSTTMVIAIIQDHQVYVGHCGDSRMYLVRDEDVFMQTTDHSMLMRGSAAGEGAGVSRHTLYNCLGASDAPFVDVSDPAPLHFRDRLLLCSDGLWGSIPEHELAYRLSARPLEEAVPEMVRSAVQIGGKTGDNVTALALTWLGADNEMGGGTFLTEGLPRDRVITSIQPAPQDESVPEVDRSGAQAIEQAMAQIRIANQKT